MGKKEKIIWSLPFQCYAYNRAYTYYIRSQKYSTRCAAFFVDKPVFSLPKCHWQIENVFFTSDIYGCHLMRFCNTNLKSFCEKTWQSEAFFSHLPLQLTINIQWKKRPCGDSSKRCNCSAIFHDLLDIGTFINRWKLWLYLIISPIYFPQVVFQIDLKKAFKLFSTLFWVWLTHVSK